MLCKLCVGILHSAFPQRRRPRKCHLGCRQWCLNLRCRCSFTKSWISSCHRYVWLWEWEWSVAKATSRSCISAPTCFVSSRLVTVVWSSSFVDGDRMSMLRLLFIFSAEKLHYDLQYSHYLFLHVYCGSHCVYTHTTSSQWLIFQFSRTRSAFNPRLENAVKSAGIPSYVD